MQRTQEPPQPALAWALMGALALIVTAMALWIFGFGGRSVASVAGSLKTEVECTLGLAYCEVSHPSLKHLHAIVDGVVVLFEAPSADGEPQTLDTLFEPVGLTPAQSCCAQSRGRCVNDDRVWDHPTWRALKFAPRRTWCRYAVERAPDGVGWRVLAVCDLDCDGVTGRFWHDIGLDEDGQLTVQPYQVSSPDAELE